MERVQVLLDKLNQQYRQKDSVSQLLITVQLLHHELISIQNKKSSVSTSKVAVVMPVAAVVNPIDIEKIQPINAEKENESRKQQPAVFSFVEKPKEEYHFQKQVVPQEAKEPESVHSLPIIVPENQFDTVSETPTLAQQQPTQKEVHEWIGQPKESLNDKLKQNQTEVAHVLKDTPIKDLRKAIGINERFVFVNELFRGDEAMYERSIKTINSFHILPEAEYWINRELKVKLGWDDYKEVVQHFYQLVRRRFS